MSISKVAYNFPFKKSNLMLTIKKFHFQQPTYKGGRIDFLNADCAKIWN